MRRVRYCVAMSLDGYIAGPNGEADWIVIDPDYDFAELYGEFDTYLVGRKTFESTGGQDRGSMPGARTYVFSRTLRQADYKNLTIVGDDWKEVVQSLREEDGKKDIWLFGGGSLFRSLAEAGLVDTVEVAVIPTILGGGVPLIAEPAPRIKLELQAQDIYKETGTVDLVYSVERA
ncbi:MAG: dihydrofolate reductase [Holophagales bacterium]|nr:dihydrofolate reductase [Holophagales bacterium]MYH25729.1 dihydrofolate reductase [Holophagales bacterium]